MWEEVEVLEVYVDFRLDFVDVFEVRGQNCFIDFNQILLVFFQSVDVVDQCGFIGI